MKEVFQTKFGLNQGNCLSACIASILEVSIEDVPDFPTTGWFDVLINYCLANNLTLMHFPLEKVQGCLFFNTHIIIIMTVEGYTENHAVVAKTNFNKIAENKWEWQAEVAHNPNPNIKTGLEATDIICIYRNQ